ncbi:MAG: hypothetical protein ACYC5Y_04880 [Symbiobacteriia bacterium]
MDTLPLGAWPELTPDPAAMEQVVALVLSGCAEPGETEPGEPHFRLLTWLWAIAVLAGYLAWSPLTEWVAEHPLVSTVIAVIACLSLLTPFVLLPVRNQQVG